MPFTEHDALQEAVKVASWSPCAKSKRGVVIFTKNGILCDGFNVPPDPFVCNGDAACRAACTKICVHAEQRALLEFQELIGNEESSPVLLPVHLLHVKVVDGAAVPSGPPSCWQCSKLILATRYMGAVWLLHDEGLRRYTKQEFHRLTLRHCGLPMVERGTQGNPVCTCADGRCVLHPPDPPDHPPNEGDEP